MKIVSIIMKLSGLWIQYMATQILMTSLSMFSGAMVVIAMIYGSILLLVISMILDVIYCIKRYFKRRKMNKLEKENSNGDEGKEQIPPV